MQNISIIRNKGQLTIPDQVRKQLAWVAPLSAVSISIVSPDEIIIRPHQPAIDWPQIRQNIQRARAVSGHKTQNAAEFLNQDRQR